MPPRRRRSPLRPLCRAVAVCALGVVTVAGAYNRHFRPAPADKNVTISNGGLSVTFNIAWGAAVVAFAAAYMTSHPGDVYSVDFSVLVSTSKRGPALASRPPFSGSSARDADHRLWRADACAF